MMRILSHVRGDRTVVSRLCCVCVTLLLALHVMMHPSDLVTQLVVLFVKHVDFVTKLLVLVSTRAAVVVEMTDVVGSCHDYLMLTF